MFRKNYHVKINLPGGIIAAGDLYSIVEAAERAKVTHIQPGNRQQLFCKVADKYGEGFLSDLSAAAIVYEANEDLYPNIVSSYVTEGIFERAGGWLSEGVYKDVLGAFDFRPRLKVNLVEGRQTFVPFFTGNINFIGSPVGNYWHLYVRWPRTTRLYAWRDLVYSGDIPRISRCIEELVMTDERGQKGDWLYDEVRKRVMPASQPVREPLEMPRFDLPYYEGFNRYGNKTWLGVYRRDELFPLSFLKDIGLICLRTRIGQLYTTPWKSLIVKGIENGDRALWDFALGKYRINVRHAANELGWQVEDCSEEGLRLKRYLVRQLDQEDTRTDGLCFAIKTRPGTGLSGSVIIRKVQERVEKRKEAERYDILHTPDFNVNSKEYVVYREGVEKENLAVYLVSLCKSFYEMQSREAPSTLREESGVGVRDRGPAEMVYQCGRCQTVYDAAYGDPGAGVPAGMAFGEIAEDYSCAVCGGGKTGFAAVEKRQLIKG